MNTVKIHLCGDIMIGRSFNETFSHNQEFNIWSDTLTVLQKSDFVLGNLETTITNSTNKWPNKVFNFKLDSQYKNILKKANISHLNIANNHILDYNLDGMIDTGKHLDSLQITYTGAGNNVNNASKTIFKLINNTKIGIVSYSDHYNYWQATDAKYGINYIDLDKDNMNILKKLEKIKNECDILILSIHYGPNYVINIPNKTKSFFHDALNAGVDIIHGHSAHHILPIECINNKYIFYSMGDFIDDYAVDSKFRNDLAFIAELSIENKKIVSLTVYPTKITVDYNNYNNYNNVILPKVSLIQKTDKDYDYVMKQLFMKIGGKLPKLTKKYKLIMN